MRKVVLYELMSLDGAVDDPNAYYADTADGGIPGWDDAMDANMARVIDAQDTVLLGRGMYEEWSRFWPTSTIQPFADFINGVRKVVVTSTPLTHDWPNASPSAGPVEDLVRDLKAQPGRDIGVHGSITLAQSLLAADLIDEIELVVGPAVGLPGRRLFTSVETVRRLELLRSERSPSGTLLLSYRVRRDRAA
jgi:dihydrofolate reductase